jgi:hypothetical protein
MMAFPTYPQQDAIWTGKSTVGYYLGYTLP